MVILRQATIKYKGYDPSTLTKGSHKRVCVSCDDCGRIRWVNYQSYRDLCFDCVMKSDNRSKKISDSLKGKMIGKLNPNYKHGLNELICKQCNKKYKVQHKIKLTSKFCSNKCRGEYQSINNKGKNNPNYKGGKITLICQMCSDKYDVQPHQKDISNFCSRKCQGEWKSIYKSGKNHYNWHGGFDTKRPWILPEINCIKLNERFNNSEFHHITKSMGAFIPKELHQHIRHNMKTGKNMGEINLLALQFINGVII